MEAPANEDITLSHSQQTLRRVKENDESLTNLWIGGTVKISGNRQVVVFTRRSGAFRLKYCDGVFNPSDDREFSS